MEREEEKRRGARAFLELEGGRGRQKKGGNFFLSSRFYSLWPGLSFSVRVARERARNQERSARILVPELNESEAHAEETL